MRMKDIIEQSFDNTINSVFKEKRPSIAKWLLNHPRKALCIENICVECRKAQLSMGDKFTRAHLEWVGREYANTFMHAALQHEKQEKMHYLEKEKMKKEYEEKKAVMDMFESEDRSESL